MFEVSTGWKIGVERADGGVSYIVVSLQQLTAVCRLLTGHGVPYVVDGAVPTRHHDDTPFAMVVQLGFAVEVRHVQDILDFAP